ncbi:MAG: hypothetical protein V5804_13365 [Mucilaginibacter sp.]|uniref:hypothetical protein n=1 Tax=Mucilaginibacter sp. TaxID=1882438 RepID=UPI0034E3CCD1
MDNNSPKLRTVNKSVPPYPLNKFPKDFPYKIGEQLVYILATRGEADIEGKEWEAIFGKAIGADWTPSVVGLDDIRMGNTAWGAKSILNKKPSTVTNIRLISGRNDLINSYNYNVQPGLFPEEHGEKVLNIYNARVSAIREKFQHLRTIILIRSKNLLECVIYEVDAIRYDPELFFWKWNGKNLYGYYKENEVQKFTWQSGGQQFTIFESVPKERLVINLRKPEVVSKDFVLDKVGFNNSWITVTELT